MGIWISFRGLGPLFLLTLGGLRKLLKSQCVLDDMRRNPFQVLDMQVQKRLSKKLSPTGNPGNAHAEDGDAAAAEKFKDCPSESAVKV